MMRSHSSGLVLTNMRSRRMPALLITTSSRPNASSAVPMMRADACQSVTSSVFATASPPSARISSTTSAAGPVDAPAPSEPPPRSFTTSRAPSRASANA